MIGDNDDDWDGFWAKMCGLWPGPAGDATLDQKDSFRRVLFNLDVEVARRAAVIRHGAKRFFPSPDEVLDFVAEARRELRPAADAAPGEDWKAVEERIRRAHEVERRTVRGELQDRDPAELAAHFMAAVMVNPNLRASAQDGPLGAINNVTVTAASLDAGTRPEEGQAFRQADTRVDDDGRLFREAAVVQLSPEHRRLAAELLPNLRRVWATKRSEREAAAALAETKRAADERRRAGRDRLSVNSLRELLGAHPQSPAMRKKAAAGPAKEERETRGDFREAAAAAMAEPPAAG